MAKPKKDARALLEAGKPNEALYICATSGGPQAVRFRALLQLAREETILESEAADPESRMLRGAALCRLGKHDEGRAILLDALKNPLLAEEAAYHLAFSFWMMQDMNTAEEWLKSAKEDSKTIELHAWVAAYRGDYKTQIRLLQEALKTASAWNRAAIIRSLAVLVKELYRPELGIVLQAEVERTKWTEDTEAFQFQALLCLASCAALDGNEAQAYRYFRDAHKYVPSDSADVMLKLERASVIRYSNADFANDEAQAAMLLADRIVWDNVRGDERMALLKLAKEISTFSPEKAFRYIQVYQNLSTPLDATSALRIDRRHSAFLNDALGTVLVSMNQKEEGIKKLKEAFGVFMAVGYRWRAALGMHMMLRSGISPTVAETYKDFLYVIGTKEFPRAWFTKMMMSDIGRAFHPDLESLRRSERLVLEQLIQGRQHKLIASELNLTIKTVEKYTTVIYRHFCVGSQAELISALAKRGII